ncbi:hypothetical protein FIBSPDRAFT_861565 [Athelia psychrophila]|uniref:Secreted protein n=1 Tax=Athelia psychrophila TaxID=1759441 RepID=A0A166J748_9AGAM|nr:hypothetical protein FIBSPDRAFT_861565 [Fibularhizoctonia sp. CBS 109695]
MPLFVGLVLCRLGFLLSDFVRECTASSIWRSSLIVLRRRKSATYRTLFPHLSASLHVAIGRYHDRCDFILGISGRSNPFGIMQRIF